MNIEDQPGVVMYHRHKDPAQLFAYIRPTEIRFSVQCGNHIGLVQDGHIVVFNIGKEWYLAVDNDNEKGYRIVSDQTRSGYRVSLSAVVRAITKDLNPGFTKVDCVLEKTNLEFHGIVCYKICKREFSGKS